MRLKMDLDLAPTEADGAALAQGLTCPEWDWKKAAYRPDHCRVYAGPATVRRQFDGDDLNLSA